MKTLNTYLKEGLLDDVNDIVNNSDQTIKDSIMRFIKDNYKCEENRLTISNKPDNNGKYIVDCNSDVVVTNVKIEYLTNGYFLWGKVKGCFKCSYCESLKTLEGAPKEVSGNFYCYECKSLKTLEGAPTYVGGLFYCVECTSLKTLEGAPKEVGGSFYCNVCKSLTSLKGAPKIVSVGDFNCIGCGKKFTIYDVKKVCNVMNGEIYV